MVKSQKNSMTLIAIISSIILLLALEVFWLRMEYENEQSRFQRETHLLLRNTVFELNDSLLHKRILSLENSKPEVQSPDSIVRATGRTIQIWVDSSTASYYATPSDKGEIVTTPHTRSLVLNLKHDSLNHEEIERKFRKELDKAGLTLPSHLIFMDATSSSPVIASNELIHTPRGVYKLEFANTNWLLLKNMIPQISFSLVLSLLVIGSFILLYRNLLLQQRLVAIKDDLISNLSHELKTPITTVGVALEGLKSFKGQNDSLASSEYLEIAEHELKRLTLLTDKVLNASLGEHHSAHYLFKELDFSVLLKEAIQTFKLIADKNQAVITLEIDHGDYQLSGDPDHLTNALFNLLDNALKYSLGPAIISVHLSCDSNYIRCSVKDNGIGIPKEYQPKIFDKFFRVPTGDLHRVKGYGLGLSYVQQVVRNHKGEIKVESEPDNGSTFVLQFLKKA